MEASTVIGLIAGVTVLVVVLSQKTHLDDSLYAIRGCKASGNILKKRTQNPFVIGVSQWWNINMVQTLIFFFCA